MNNEENSCMYFQQDRFFDEQKDNCRKQLLHSPYVSTFDSSLWKLTAELYKDKFNYCQNILHLKMCRYYRTCLRTAVNHARFKVFLLTTF